MIHVDASEYQRFEREFRRLPHELKAKAFSRAMRRVNKMMRTQVIRRSSERIKLPQKHIRPTYTMLSVGSATLEHVVRSGWIPLYKLGASPSAKGVRINRRGTIDGAFIARMASGHTGVFKRTDKSRLPIQELFGPNPASDIANHPDVFEKVLMGLIDPELTKRMLHELSRMLPK